MSWRRFRPSTSMTNDAGLRRRHRAAAVLVPAAEEHDVPARPATSAAARRRQGRSSSNSATCPVSRSIVAITDRPGSPTADSRVKTILRPSPENATDSADGQDATQSVSIGCGRLPLGVGQVELAAVREQQAGAVGRPADDGLDADAIREELVRTAPVRPDDPYARRRARGRLPETAGADLVDIADEGDQPARPQVRGRRRRLRRRIGRASAGRREQRRRRLRRHDRWEPHQARTRRRARRRRPGSPRRQQGEAAAAADRDGSGAGVVRGIVTRRSRRSAGAVTVVSTSAAYQARSRCSSSRSVIGRSPWCRSRRSRRAAA